jgi:dienelactone hydrolase
VQRRSHPPIGTPYSNGLQRDRRQFLATCAAALLPTHLAGADADPFGYTKEPFTHGAITLDVWRAGSLDDPLVFIFHDIIGLSRSCFDLGNALIKNRYSVAIPRFFGDFGGFVLGYLKACNFGNQFRCYEANDYGPIMPWIKALAHRGSGSTPFGAIGNCMTGILPLLMLRSQRCHAPVLCQPAFPFRSALFDKVYRSQLGLPQIDQDFAAFRTSSGNIPVLGVRFQIDSRCRPERFHAIRALLGDRFQCLELPGKGHSTLLGDHASPVAFDAVVNFLNYRLKGGEPWALPCNACTSPSCTGTGSHR